MKITQYMEPMLPCTALYLQIRVVGLDVHPATIVVAVLDSTGKLVMESILETEAATILQFLAGLRGTLSVTFEEGAWSARLYDLLSPHVDQRYDAPRSKSMERKNSKGLSGWFCGRPAIQRKHRAAMTPPTRAMSARLLTGHHPKSRKSTTAPCLSLS